MADLYASITRIPIYWDRQSVTNANEWFDTIAKSNVLYIGNLNPMTTEEAIYEIFSACGLILRIIIGLNKKNKNIPCGFAFIQYSTHEEAAFAFANLNGTILDDKKIRCDWDIGKGIMMNRRYGRAIDGKQKRDYRAEEMLAQQEEHNL